MSYSVKWLQGEIKQLEETIAIRKGLGKDCAELNELLKSWKSYLPGHRNHHKLRQRP